MLPIYARKLSELLIGSQPRGRGADGLPQLLPFVPGPLLQPLGDEVAMMRHDVDRQTHHLEGSEDPPVGDCLALIPVDEDHIPTFDVDGPRVSVRRLGHATLDVEVRWHPTYRVIPEDRHLVVRTDPIETEEGVHHRPALLLREGGGVVVRLLLLVVFNEVRIEDEHRLVCVQTSATR